MTIKPLSELVTPDERTLHFTPLGLSGGTLTPEHASDFQQGTISELTLAPQVSEGTRLRFEQLRTVHAYGVLCYEIYTLIGEVGLLVFEQALRDRFIDFHDGRVTFINKTGQEQKVEATNYDDFYKAIKNKRTWKLVVGDGPLTIAFNGMLDGLRTWARHLGFLRGQRNRHYEEIFTELRNMVAHPSSYHLDTPVGAATTMRELAEIINHLWGQPTPGGRLYPAPLAREIMAIGWNDTKTVSTLSENLRLDGYDPDQLDYVLVRAVPEDPELLSFDSRHERTRWPVQYLWGPGTAPQAVAWLDEHGPQDDAIDPLDQLFVIQRTTERIYLPRTPAIAAALPAKEQDGTWYLVRADHTNDALTHIRYLAAHRANLPETGECDACAADLVIAGSWHEAMAAAHAAGADTTPTVTPDIQTLASTRVSGRYLAP